MEGAGESREPQFERAGASGGVPFVPFACYCLVKLFSPCVLPWKVSAVETGNMVSLVLRGVVCVLLHLVLGLTAGRNDFSELRRIAERRFVLELGFWYGFCRVSKILYT